MGSGGQKKHVIGAVAQQFTESVTLALVSLIPCRHPVCLVHDDQVPVGLPEAGQDLGALGQIQRGDHLLLLHPLVDTELIADVAPLQHQELLVELLLEFALPLKRQVGRADDENPFDEAPQLEFADEQAGHDRLARPRIVGQQEAHAGELQEMLVDRLKLVRQRVHARDGKTEVGIEFVGNAEPIGLQGDPEKPPVTIVGERGVGNRQVGKVI